MTAALSTRQLSIRRGEAAALDSVTLAFDAGTFVAIVGENGAGKSTLLDALAGILPPTTGEVFVEEIVLARLSPRQRAQRISSVGQTPPVAPDLGVFDRIGQGLAPRRGAGAFLDDHAKACVVKAATALGVDALGERTLAELSGGERRRVEIARGLVDVDASVVLVDEPLANVDVRRASAVLGALKDRARQGALVVASVHDLGRAFRHADVIVGLRNGGVVDVGPPAQVLSPAGILEIFGVEGQIVDDERGVGATFA